MHAAKRGGPHDPQLLELLGRIVGHIGKCGYRRCGHVIPVAVKHFRDVVDHRPNAYNVDVTEVDIFARAEIFGGDVPTPNNGYLIVNGKRLIVHAAIHTPEIAKRVTEAPRAARKRIEYSNLEIWMRIQCCHACVISFGLNVIDQQTYAHAPIGENVALWRGLSRGRQ